MQIIGGTIDTEGMANTKAFIAKYPPAFPMGEGEMMRFQTFAQWSPMMRTCVPYLFFIDRKGMIRAQYMGSDPFYQSEAPNIRKMLDTLVSEGGATWVPFIGDRMNEGYRQHGMFVRPQLSRLPKEILYRQVYASFQHDESAPAALWAMGYHNVLWGSDYPHLEGTFGHTQKTLHELFDDVAPEVRQRITRGAFEELFPHVSAPPA